jgi:hypothetical protein
MPTLTALVEEVKILKQGTSTKTGKPWALLGVRAGGKTLTTFDGTWQAKQGQTVAVEYDEVQNTRDGKTYTDYRIRDPKKQQQGGGNAQVVGLLTEIRDLLAESLRRSERQDSGAGAAPGRLPGPSTPRTEVPLAPEVSQETALHRLHAVMLRLRMTEPQVLLIARKLFGPGITQIPNLDDEHLDQLIGEIDV